MSGVSRHQRLVETSEMMTVPSVSSSWKPAAGTGVLGSLVHVPPGVAGGRTAAFGSAAAWSAVSGDAPGSEADPGASSRPAQLAPTRSRPHASGLIIVAPRSRDVARDVV